MSTETLAPPEVVEVVPRKPEDAVLALLADFLDIMEQVRIGADNRTRQLTRTEQDSDGVMRGFGLSPDLPQVQYLMDISNSFQEAEAKAQKALTGWLKAHPLGKWIKSQKGIGEKQGARLLAAIGDPYWHPLHNRPRKVSELWSFCGYGVWRLDPATHERIEGPSDSDLGIAPYRKRGSRSNWNATARMRVYLIAEACVKQRCTTCKTWQEDHPYGHAPEGCACSKYRVVYDEGRLRYADAVHRVACKRCGPSGHPAPVGSPLSDGHKHARAMRMLSKEVLREMWLASKAVHEANGDV